MCSRLRLTDFGPSPHKHFHGGAGRGREANMKRSLYYDKKKDKKKKRAIKKPAGVPLSHRGVGTVPSPLLPSVCSTKHEPPSARDTTNAAAAIHHPSPRALAPGTRVQEIYQLYITAVKQNTIREKEKENAKITYFIYPHGEALRRATNKHRNRPAPYGTTNNTHTSSQGERTKRTLTTPLSRRCRRGPPPTNTTPPA